MSARTPTVTRPDDAPVVRDPRPNSSATAPLRPRTVETRVA